MILALEIEFLGTPQLADPARPEWPEWPPAPDRVYQALVATAAETGKDLSMLRPLENTLPDVHCTWAQMAQAPLRYVPENFRRPSGYHTGAKQYLPTALPDSPVVTYVWHHQMAETLAFIKALAPNVTHIGRASSFVRAVCRDRVDSDPALVPSEDGTEQLRCALPGRLKGLQDAFEQGHPSPMVQPVKYRRNAIHHPSPGFSDLMALKVQPRLDSRTAVRMVEALRASTMSSVSEDIPPLISGHGSERRLAWAALPDVGHRHAKGEVIGLGCWLPKDITPQETGLVWFHLSRLKELQGRKLMLDSQGLKSLSFDTWSRPSEQWGSVTPIALDRWPKKNLSAEKIIADSLSRQGLPEPASLEVSALSAFTGAPAANRYLSRKGNRQLVHAVIRWHIPVAGPLLLGADRFFGGGLCRPIQTGWR